MDLFIDESGNDKADVAFHVVGVRPASPSETDRQLRRLRNAWPVFFDTGLKAATAGCAGWLAARWLDAAPHLAAGGPPVTMDDLRSAQFDRRDFVVLLAAAACQGTLTLASLEAAKSNGELRLDELDIPFARWAHALHAATRGTPLPAAAARSLTALRTWYLTLPMPQDAEFPRRFEARYHRALFHGQGEVLGTQEVPPGHLLPDRRRYLVHLEGLIRASREAGASRLYVQSRDVPQAAAAGTPLADALQPLSERVVYGLGAAGMKVEVVRFWAVADLRVGHRVADAAAYVFRQRRKAGSFAIQNIAVPE